MTFAIGGSAKVRRVVKQARTGPWACRSCVVYEQQDVASPDGTTVWATRLHPAALVRCPDCGTKRP